MHGLVTFIGAFPAASIAAVRQSFLSIGIEDNSVGLFSELMDSASLFVTANRDTIHFIGFVDLSDGPLVIDVPALGPPSGIIEPLGGASREVPLQACPSRDGEPLAAESRLGSLDQGGAAVRGRDLEASTGEDGRIYSGPKGGVEQDAGGGNAPQQASHGRLGDRGALAKRLVVRGPVVVTSQLLVWIRQVYSPA